MGADGILWGPIESEEANWALRIFNPDGSEAEKSGNGLRIFARYLRDTGHVKTDSFSLMTKGGRVNVRIHPKSEGISVEMGRVSSNTSAAR